MYSEPIIARMARVTQAPNFRLYVLGGYEKKDALKFWLGDRLARIRVAQVDNNGVEDVWLRLVGKAYPNEVHGDNATPQERISVTPAFARACIARRVALRQERNPPCC